MTDELEQQRKGTNNRITILDRKQSDDLLRECGYETKAATPAGEEVILEQSEDMKGNWVQTVRLANGEEIVRKTPQYSVTPAVSGEVREQIAKIICCPGGCILATCGDDACVALNPEYTMLPTADAILAALSAASPASPLRGSTDAWALRLATLEGAIHDSIESLERNSTSAPVVECLKAALASARLIKVKMD